MKRKRSSGDAKSLKPVAPHKPFVSQVKTKLLSFQATPTSTPETQSSYLHETLEFLAPDKLRDANGNRPDSPEYDHTTLKVPSDFMKKLTPAMYQWWAIKSKHFDVILFFKVS